MQDEAALETPVFAPVLRRQESARHALRRLKSRRRRRHRRVLREIIPDKLEARRIGPPDCRPLLPEPLHIALDLEADADPLPELDFFSSVEDDGDPVYRQELQRRDQQLFAAAHPALQRLAFA